MSLAEPGYDKATTYFDKNSAAAADPPKGHVEESVDFLTDRLDSLGMALDRLAMRLRPALMPDMAPPGEARLNPEEPIRCEVAGRIAESADRVGALTAVLAGLTDRIDL